MNSRTTKDGESSSYMEVGIDVSKDLLDYSLNGDRGQIPNSRREILRWLESSKQEGSIRVSVEATGSYTREIILACLQLDIPISLLNPRNVRSYARARGLLAKTDKIDAALIADYSSTFNPGLLDDDWPARDELRQFHCRLQDLIASRAKRRTSLEHYHSKPIRAEIKREIVALGRRIDSYKKAIDQIIQSKLDLCSRKDVMEKIIGVGDATSTTLLIHMPELGSLNRQQAAALAGLAPMNRDSGAGRGKRTIQAGRAEPRRLLYMAALTAAHRNPDYKEFYKRLREQGKPVKICLVAIARKLLIQINSSLKNIPQQPIPNT